MTNLHYKVSGKMRQEQNFEKELAAHADVYKIDLEAIGIEACLQRKVAITAAFLARVLVPPT